MVDLSTRHWWIIATVLLLVAAAGVGVPIALKISSNASFEERLEFATRLLQEVPLIDGHNDLPWNIRKFLHNKLKNFKFNEDLREVAPWSESAWSHTDLLRLEQGHVAAQVSIYMHNETKFCQNKILGGFQEINIAKILRVPSIIYRTRCTFQEIRAFVSYY